MNPFLYVQACENYWGILAEAYEAGIRPPSNTWMSVCESLGIRMMTGNDPPSPWAGWTVCPVCRRSHPYKLKPETGFCSEWHLHPDEKCLKMPIEECWEAASITSLRRDERFAPFLPPMAAVSKDSSAGTGLSLQALSKKSRLNIEKKKKWRRSSNNPQNQRSLI